MIICKSTRTESFSSAFNFSVGFLLEQTSSAKIVLTVYFNYKSICKSETFWAVGPRWPVRDYVPFHLEDVFQSGRSCKLLHVHTWSPRLCHQCFHAGISGLYLLQHIPILLIPRLLKGNWSRITNLKVLVSWVAFTCIWGEPMPLLMWEKQEKKWCWQTRKKL